MKIPWRVELHVITLAVLIAAAVLLAVETGRYAARREWEVVGGLDLGEVSDLERTYGPMRNSQQGEEWIVRDFFKDKRDGIFVDVGANDYRRFSNTYYLEISLGWSGLAIEPQTKFAADYARYRPRSTFVPLFVSDTSNREATLHVPPNDLIASASREFAEAESGSRTQAIQVRTTTLDDVLDRTGTTHIDFLTMDIELAEPKALAGFSIQRFKPALVCVEAHFAVRQAILDYFARNGYVLVGKYLRADGRNLWFAPLAGVG